MKKIKKTKTDRIDIALSLCRMALSVVLRGVTYTDHSSVTKDKSSRINPIVLTFSNTRNTRLYSQYLSRNILDSQSGQFILQVKKKFYIENELK